MAITVDRPVLFAVDGGNDPEAVEHGRRRAALAIVAGYEQAITCLDPSDVDELRWHHERLRDARLAAGVGRTS